jgi:MFS family permease
MLPLLGGMTISSALGGRLVSRLGRYRPVVLAGTTLAAAAMTAFAMMDAGTGHLLISGVMVVFGLGIGVIYQNLLVGAQATAADHDLGAATSTISTARGPGGAVGVSVLGAVFSSRLGATAAGAAVSGSQPSVDSRYVLHPGLDDAARAAFADSIAGVFLCTAVVLAVAFAPVWLLPKTRLAPDDPDRVVFELPEAASGKPSRGQRAAVAVVPTAVGDEWDTQALRRWCGGMI